MLRGLWGAPFPGGTPLVCLPALSHPWHLNTSRGHVSRGTDVLRALRFLVCWSLEATGGFSSRQPEPFWGWDLSAGHKFNLWLFPSSQNFAERGGNGVVLPGRIAWRWGSWSMFGGADLRGQHQLPRRCPSSLPPHPKALEWHQKMSLRRKEHGGVAKKPCSPQEA